MEQVFNELSISGAHSNKYEALEALRDACHVSKLLEKIGFEPRIRITQDFSLRELAHGYTYNDLIRDKDVRQKYQIEYSFMLSRFSKSPYVEDLCTEHGMTEFEEYNFGGSACWGLALANIWGIPAISLAGNESFTGGFVFIVHAFMDENASILTQEYSVLTLTQRTDVEEHEDSIKKTLRTDFNSGGDILARVEEALPYLIFCGNAPRQLQDIDRTNPRFRRIVEILYGLNEAMHLVKEPNDIFAPQGMHYTTRESASTSEMPNTRAARTFLCPDSESRFFGEHVRINRAMRIHIFSDKNRRKIYIGHIGEHLQTSTS